MFDSDDDSDDDDADSDDDADADSDAESDSDADSSESAAGSDDDADLGRGASDPMEILAMLERQLRHLQERQAEGSFSERHARAAPVYTVDESSAAIQRARDLRERGNAEFQTRNFDEALRLYTDAAQTARFQTPSEEQAAEQKTALVLALSNKVGLFIICVALNTAIEIFHPQPHHGLHRPPASSSSAGPTRLASRALQPSARTSTMPKPSTAAPR